MGEQVDLVRMVAQMDADYSALEKQMRKMNSVFDAECRKAETRHTGLLKHLSGGTMKFAGIDSIKTALAGLTAAAVVKGLDDVFTSSLDAAKGIADIAEQSGQSVERVQQLRFAANQLGATFSDLDAGLIFFNRSFGEFINTGRGKAAVDFKVIGLDKAINSGQVRDAAGGLDYVLDKVRSYQSEAQRAGFMARFFGEESGPKLVGLVNSGAAAISALEQKAVSLGVVMSGDTIRDAVQAKAKLSELFEVMEAEGVAAVVELAPQIADLAQRLTDALPSIIAWTEHWAAWFGLIERNPVQELKYQIDGITGEIDELNERMQKKDGIEGFFNSISTEGLKKSIRMKRETLAPLLAQYNDSLEDQFAAAFGEESDAEGQPKPKPPPKLHVNDIAGQQAAEELAEKRREMLAQLGVDAATANAALAAADNSLNVKKLAGLAGYHAAVLKQIDDERKAKFDEIEAEQKKQQEALEKLKLPPSLAKAFSDKIDATAKTKKSATQDEADEKAYEVSPESFLKDALREGSQQIRQYSDQTAALGLTAAAVAGLTYAQQKLNDADDKDLPISAAQIAQITAKGAAVAKSAQEANDAEREMQRTISVSDDVRSGLEDVGAAGSRGFRSMEDAAKSFLQTLLAMIIKLYAMQPLVESLLGQPGTPLGSGGILGSLLGNGQYGTGLGTLGFTPGPDPVLQSLGSAGTSGWSWLSSLFSWAKGGVMTGGGPLPLRRYAGGGIARTPQLSLFGEKSGQAEAYVPLPDGRRIPVAMHMPRMPSVAGMNRQATINAPVTVHQYLDGAVSPEGIADIAQKQATVMGAGLVRELNNRMPQMIQDAFNKSL